MSNQSEAAFLCKPIGAKLWPMSNIRALGELQLSVGLLFWNFWNLSHETVHLINSTRQFTVHKSCATCFISNYLARPYPLLSASLLERRHGLYLSTMQAMPSLHDGCVHLLYSWKFHQLAAGQMLSGQPVWYEKGRRYGPSITYIITFAESLFSSQPGGPPGWTSPLAYTTHPTP